MNNIKSTVKDAELQAEKYFDSSNNILGLLSFTIAIGCLGVSNSIFYAWCGLFFLPFVWRNSFKNYSKQLNMLRNIDHPKM